MPAHAPSIDSGLMCGFLVEQQSEEGATCVSSDRQCLECLTRCINPLRVSVRVLRQLSLFNIRVLSRVSSLSATVQKPGYLDVNFCPNDTRTCEGYIYRFSALMLHFFLATQSFVPSEPYSSGRAHLLGLELQG